MSNIFISYRRDDAAYATAYINDRLRQEFGEESVLADIDDIPLGVDFRDYLDEKVSQCEILLAVIGNEWLTAKSKNGDFRLHDPADFVRIEIESALERNIPVIPLLVDGVTMPSPDDLPEPLERLAYRNAIVVRPAPDFGTDVERLVKSLKRLLDKGNTEPIRGEAGRDLDDLSQGLGSENDNADFTSSGTAKPLFGSSRLARRLRAGTMLRQILGDDGLALLKKRNWTLTSFGLVALGVISDLMQIFGPISKIGLITSGMAAAIFGLIVFFRLRGRTFCVGPFVNSVLLAAMFAAIIIAQNTADADDEGFIAGQFPQASAIQRAIFAKLTSIEAGQERLEVGQGRMETRLEELIEKIERANPDADPATIEAFRTAAERLEASGDARKRRALADYADGEEDRAITDLMRLAEDQTDTAKGNTRRAADTWKEVGALAFFSDTDKALSAYKSAIELSPDDLEAHNQMGQLLRRIGDLDSARSHYTYILKKSAATDRIWRSGSLIGLGIIEQTRGDLDAAADYYKRSLAIFEDLGHKSGIAGALNNLGAIEQTRGNLDAAADYYTRSLALLEEVGDKSRIASALNNLGVIEQTRGNLDAAQGYYARSLALREEIGNKSGIASSLNNLGLIEKDRDNLDAAADYYTRSLALNEEMGDKSGIASALNNLGVIEQTRVNLDAAQGYYARSLALNEEMGDKSGIASSLNNLGAIERARGNLDAAADHYNRSLALFEELGSPAGTARALFNIGRVERTRGNLDAAMDHYSRSLALYEELGRKSNIAATHANIGGVERTRGNLDAAMDHYSRSLALYEELGRKSNIAATHANIGGVERTRGNLDAAMDHYSRSLALYEELGRKSNIAATHANIGFVEKARGNMNAACSLWKRSAETFTEIGETSNHGKAQRLIDRDCAETL